MRRDAPEPDGPPPPPFVRERRARRRRWIWASSAIGAVVIIGVSLALAWPSLTDADEEPVAGDVPDPDEGAEPEAPEAPDTPEAPEAPPGEGEPAPDLPDPGIDLELDEDGRPDRAIPQEEAIAPLEVDEVPETQRPVAELLLDIDASERSMLSFQIEVQAAFADAQDPDDPDALDSRIRTAAAQALEELDLLRDRMQTPQDAAWADDVRDTYVDHLDSWVRYLGVIHDDPQILLEDTSRYSLDINVTGAAFSRAVHADTAEQIDDEVVRFAEDLIARGFPPPEDSQV